MIDSELAIVLVVTLVTGTILGLYTGMWMLGTLLLGTVMLIYTIIYSLKLNRMLP